MPISRVLYLRRGGDDGYLSSSSITAGIKRPCGLAPGKCFPHDIVANIVCGLLLYLAEAGYPTRRWAHSFHPCLCHYAEF